MDERITGAEALIRGLIEENVDTVFGYPGGAIIPVYDKLFDYTDQIKHVLARHEQGAAHMAQGYARISGRPGVVIVTSGPAATNIITGLSDAQKDSTPVVFIIGQVSTSLLGRDAFQETDVVGITQPISKWAYQVRKADDMAWALSRAFYIATQGRPGPVVLDITKDAQLGLVNWKYEKCHYIRSYNPVPKPDIAAVSNVADMINSAKRPMILAGQGITISGAEKELAALAEKADIPVAATLMGLSSMPSSHPLYKGMLGMHGNIGPNYNTNQADLIIAIGMRFDDRVTGNPDGYAPHAKIVHIDIDESEFGKNIRTDATVHADAKDALNALMPMVREASHQEWLRTFDEAAAVENEKVMEPELHSQGMITMGEMARKVSLAAGPDAVLVTDVGQNQMLSARYFVYQSPRSIITSGGLGTMGFGLPAAIGAKMGAPGRPVLFFTGDGGLQMTIQEFGTIMEYGTAVKIILLNNNFLGNVRQWQVLFYKSRLSQTPLLNPDFNAVAAAYGIPAETVSDRSQLDSAIRRMLDHDGPYMLNVSIDPNEMVFPMTPNGADVDFIMLNPSEKYNP